MTKYFIGAIGALGGMLIGGWLMLAPFALAYQPSGADWADPTYTNFWSGLAVLVISLIGLITYVLGLVGELRRLGVIEERREEESQLQQAQAQQAQVSGTPVAPTGAETPAGSGDIEQILLPLVTAMLKDMQDQRQDQRREGDGEAVREAQHQAPQSGAAPNAPNERFDPERRVQQ